MDTDHADSNEKKAKFKPVKLKKRLSKSALTKARLDPQFEEKIDRLIQSILDDPNSPFN